MKTEIFARVSAALRNSLKRGAIVRLAGILVRLISSPVPVLGTLH